LTSSSDGSGLDLSLLVTSPLVAPVFRRICASSDIVGITNEAAPEPIRPRRPLIHLPGRCFRLHTIPLLSLTLQLSAQQEWEDSLYTTDRE
jgi:hypothetical protein